MRAWRGSPPAARRLVAAYGSLPPGVIDLACHAAVPVAVDVGLLHLIRVNFLLDPPVVVPYEAEADLLLSPLVRELGDGLFDIDPLLRPLLLAGLSRRFGPARPRRVAALLEQYTMRAPAWQDRPELRHAQRLTAVAVIDPPLAADWLARAETSIADGTALLGKEWLVAVRRSVGDHATADRSPDGDVYDAFEALVSGTVETRTAAVHRLGELALVPGADVEAIARVLAAHADGDDGPSGRTARAVLDTITGLGPALTGVDEPSAVLERTARQHLLDTWRAVVAESYVDGAWRWSPGERRSSISDAQQLLCLLLPAVEVPQLALDRPDDTATEVLEALRGVGDSVEIPRLLVRLAAEHLRAYESGDGMPVFTGALEGATDEQAALELTEAYAVSVRLTLAVLGFVRVYRSTVSRRDLQEQCDEVDRLAGARLTAAMVGLLRSFAVSLFSDDSELGSELVRRHGPRFHDGLRSLIANFRTMTIGSGTVDPDFLERPGALFDCGWSWGVVRDAPMVETDAPMLIQQQGWASPDPDPWSTMLAVEAIQALYSERTRILGLLDEEQQRLSRALQLRLDQTCEYWLLRGAVAVDTPGDRLAVGAVITMAEATRGNRVGDRPGAAATLLTELAEGELPPVAYPLAGTEALGPRLDVNRREFAVRLLLELDRLARLGRPDDHDTALVGARDTALAALLMAIRAGPDDAPGRLATWAETFGAVEVFTGRVRR